MLKPIMTYEEMLEAYLTTKPIFLPNHVRVGKFAKQQGYRRERQMINNKTIYFYVR